MERERGQSLVELALLLPLLVFLIAGGVDFGRVYAFDVAARNGARAGAEIAAVRGWSTSANDAAITAQATDELQRVPAYRASDATVSVTHTAAGGVNFVNVRVQYTFRTIVAWPLLPQSAPIDRTVTFRNYP